MSDISGTSFSFAALRVRGRVLAARVATTFGSRRLRWLGALCLVCLALSQRAPGQRWRNRYHYNGELKPGSSETGLRRTQRQRHADDPEAIHAKEVAFRGVMSEDGRWKASVKVVAGSESVTIRDASGRRLTFGEVAGLWSDPAFAQWFNGLLAA